MKHLFPIGMVVVFTMLIIIGCNHSSTGPATVSTDSQQISDLTTNEYSDYFSFDDFEEGDAYGGSSSDQLDTTIVPLRWGRVVNAFTNRVTVTVDSPNTDTARVTVSRDVHGYLRIGTSSGVINKPFHDVYTKSGVFFRRGHTTNRFLNWRLVRVSGIEGRTQNPPAPIEIGSVSWWKKTRNNGNWGAWSQVGATVTDPTTFWQVADSIPVFSGSDSIRIDVTMNGVNTPNAWYGQFHCRPHGVFTAATRIPFDTLGNNQFRVYGRIPILQTSNNRRAYIDFTTWPTLHDDILTDYAANVWGLLYKVN